MPPGDYSVDGTHPIVYSGKNSHGSYHDDGGSGGCCYWEDFRKPGNPFIPSACSEMSCNSIMISLIETSKYDLYKIK